MPGDGIDGDGKQRCLVVMHLEAHPSVRGGSGTAHVERSLADALDVEYSGVLVVAGFALMAIGKDLRPLVTNIYLVQRDVAGSPRLDHAIAQFRGDAAAHTW